MPTARLLCLPAADTDGKKQLVLSAAGWQPGGGGGLGEGATLLCFSYSADGQLPPAELPASLLRHGFWSVQAFERAHMQVGTVAARRGWGCSVGLRMNSSVLPGALPVPQVSLDLGSGRTASMAVTAATTYADVKRHASFLLAVSLLRVRLWHKGEEVPSYEGSVVPGSQLRVRVQPRARERGRHGKLACDDSCCLAGAGMRAAARAVGCCNSTRFH